MENLIGVGAPRGRGRGRGRGRQPRIIPMQALNQPEQQQPALNEIQEMRRIMQEQRTMIDTLLTDRQGRRDERQQADGQQQNDEGEENNNDHEDEQNSEAEGSEQSQSPPRQERELARLPQPNQGVDTLQCWVTRFCKQKPPAFRGKMDSAEDWLMRLDKIFEVLECPEDRKAQLAIYKLEGDADRWWRSIATILRARQCPVTWEKFQEKFNEQYFPPSVQRTKEAEFLHICQGQEESFDDYFARFTNLSRYSSHLRRDDNESSMANILVYGVKYEIQEKLVSQQFTELVQAVESCRLIERNLQNLQKARVLNSSNAKASRDGLSRGNSSQKRVAPWNNSQKESKVPFQSGQKNNSGMTGPNPCPKCGTNHPGTNCARERICYKCQKPGHFYTDCPQRTAAIRPQNPGRVFAMIKDETEKSPEMAHATIPR